MPSIGTFELFTILVVVLLLFGPAKLPDVGRQIGRAVREVRRVESSLRSEWTGLLDDPAPSAAPPTLAPKARAEEPQEEASAGGGQPGRPGGDQPKSAIPEASEDDPSSDPHGSGGPAG